MKLTPRSLMTSCVITLARNYRYINFTILPQELAEEIMKAIRDPNYGEQQKTVCFIDGDPKYHTDIVDYLYHHDPQKLRPISAELCSAEMVRACANQNPILRRYGRDTEHYTTFLEYRALGISPIGVIYDGSCDIFIVTHYMLIAHRSGFYYLEEDLPPPLLRQLETKYAVRLVEIPVSSLSVTIGQW